jgi:hypothetical protein
MRRKAPTSFRLPHRDGRLALLTAGLPLLLGLLASLDATLCPVHANEPATEFLDALRKADYHDEALLYLEKMADSPLATTEFKQAIALQRGLTLISASRRSTNNTLRTHMLVQAEASLREFVQLHSQHPLLTEAQIQLGNVLVEKADQQMALAQRGENKTLIIAARKSFADAHKYFVGIRDNLKEKLERVNKVQFDPSQREQRDARLRLREDYLQSLIYVASVLEAAAEAEADGSEERKKLLEQAAAEFGTIYEEYRRRTVGLYSRLYQGRCLQKLGQELDALSLYTDLFDQPNDDPVFRDVKLQAMELAMRIWLDKKHNKFAEAVNRSSGWLRTAEKAERDTQRGCAIRLSAAQANKDYADYLDENQPGNNQSKQLRADAREIALELTKIRNPYQDEARAILAALRGEGGNENTEVPRGINFAAARDLSNEAMQEFQNAGYLMALLPERIQFEKDADEKQKLEKRLEQAKKDLGRFRQQALVNLELALKFADEETPIDEINLIRVFLAQIYLSHGEYFDCAVMGEFLARHFATTPTAKPAAQLALNAYQQITRTMPEAKEFGEAKQKELSQYMLATWPEDPESADAALVLLTFAVQARDLDLARSLLGKVPAVSEKRGEAERLHGRAVWTAFLKETAGEQAGAPRSEAAQTLAKEAMDVLASGVGQLKSDQRINFTTGLSVLALAQAYLENRQPVDAMRITDASYGPLKLIEPDGPFSKNAPLAEECLRTALLAYAGSANEEGAGMKIKSTMTALKSHIGNNPDSKKRLIGTLIGVAQNLKKQLDAAETNERALLSQNFATFLGQVGNEATDYQTLFWVGDSFRTLALASDVGTGKPPKESHDFYSKANEVYDSLIAKGKADRNFYPTADSVIQVQVRLVTVKRRLGEFKAAMALLVEILSKRPTMVNVQKEAALTYQEWAGFPSSTSLYLKAVTGAYPDKERKNQNAVWGWAKIASATQGNAKFRADYLDARLQMATCRYSYGVTLKGSKKTQYLGFAKKDIIYTLRQSSDLGGGEMRKEFDNLLRKIQTELKEPVRGLAALTKTKPKK